MKTTSGRICGALLGLCVLSVIEPGVRADETADWMAEMRRQNDEFNRQAQEDRDARDKFNREAQEELGLTLAVSDLHLTGLVSEDGYQGQSHWLMFLFEVKPRLIHVPPAHREGRFQFFPRETLTQLNIPQTDLEQIWPWFWQHRGGFFAAHCHCRSDGTNEWTLEESR